MNLNVPVELHNSIKAETAAQGPKHDQVLMESHPVLRRQACSEAEGTAPVKRTPLYLRVSSVICQPPPNDPRLLRESRIIICDLD